MLSYDEGVTIKTEVEYVPARSKGKVQSYQKDKRDILQFVPKLRKAKKNSSTYSKD